MLSDQQGDLWNSSRWPETHQDSAGHLQNRGEEGNVLPQYWKPLACKGSLLHLQLCIVPALFPKCFLFDHLNSDITRILFLLGFIFQNTDVLFLRSWSCKWVSLGRALCNETDFTESLSGSREQNWAFPSCWWKLRVETSKGFCQDFSKSCFKLTIPVWIMEPIPYIVKN